MNSKVFLLDAKDISFENIQKLFKECDINFLKPKEITAVKIHFGEKGNKAYLKPEKVIPIINSLNKIGVWPFLTDANTIYKGYRADAVNHLKTAYQHKYNPENIGAPIIIADGLTGKDYIKVKVDLKHFKEVNIGSAAVHADSMVVLSHFKGHEVTGFGGALKNVGMGLGSRSGKQMMHSDVKPSPKLDKCTGCGKCMEWCPTNAIKIIDKKVNIDIGKCIGCGECVASCNFGAIEVSWAGSPDVIQEKIAEYFYGVWKDKKDKMVFLNYAIDISPNCDCFEWNDPPIVPDIGILASNDPVAIDQACVDMLNKTEWSDASKQKTGSKDKLRTIYPNSDWTVQLDYAEKLGIGSRKYQLIKI